MSFRGRVGGNRVPVRKGDYISPYSQPYTFDEPRLEEVFDGFSIPTLVVVLARPALPRSAFCNLRGDRVYRDFQLRLGVFARELIHERRCQ